MNLLLLSLNPGAVPSFLADSVGELSRPLRLGYISDASAGMPFAAAERAGIAAFGHELVEMRVRDTDAQTFDNALRSLDAVYVASGETFLLLEALQSNSTDAVLAARVRAGLPYIGCSAGSIIAGSSVTPLELMDDREVAPKLKSDSGLGLIKQVVVPHADGKIPPYPLELIEQILTTYGEHYELIPLRDDQALRVSATGAEVTASASLCVRLSA